jgi:NAD(P)-dependent dehydrogenase (short-subunit alcohol dehydrogenase family)
MVADTVAKFGRLDIMCANAGIAEFKPFIETDEATWDRLFAVNAKGVFFCDKHAARQMIKQGSGRIINASSIVGKVAAGPSVPLGAYTASKHAVIGITRSFALELAPHNVLVHCICPSAIETSRAPSTPRRSLGLARAGFLRRASICCGDCCLG